MNKNLKFIAVNIIICALVIIGFEEIFLKKYYDGFIHLYKEIGHIQSMETNHIKDVCKENLKFSSVDTRGPALLRDQYFGFFLNPNVVGTNAQGTLFDCIDDANERDFNVVLIGDSFTASIQVPIEKTWPAHIRSLLQQQLGREDVRIFNLAVGGAGMINQLRQLEYSLENLKPDLIIHSLFLGNDFTDEDYESFQLVHHPHRNFPPYPFVVEHKDGLMQIEPTIPYYLMMNFVGLVRNGGSALHTEFGTFSIKVDWFLNDAIALDDRFNLELEVGGENYPLKEAHWYPITKRLASDVAIEFHFDTPTGRLVLEVLRSDNYDANAKGVVFARVCSLGSGKCTKPSNFVHDNNNRTAQLYEVQRPRSDERKLNPGLFKKSELKPLKTDQSLQSYIPFQRTVGMFRILFDRIFTANLDELTTEGIGRDSINGMPRQYMVFVNEDTEYIEKRMRIFKSHLKYINSLVENENYVFTTIPSMLTASSRFWEFSNISEISEYATNRLQPLALAESAISITNLKNNSFFDFLDRKFVDKFGLYDPIHRHFTPEGHAVFAQFIMQTLQTSGALPLSSVSNP